MKKLGIIGTSKIAHDMAAAAVSTGFWKIGMIYSREMARAKRFAEEFDGAKACCDIAAAADAKADAVYIASPNALHVKQAEYFLKSKKHVICEKPFTVQVNEALALYRLAESEKVICMEAMPTVHLPWLYDLKKAVQSIGNISIARFDFCQRSDGYDEYLTGRMPNGYNPKFATGAIMDLGTYCVYAAIELFGKPLSVHAEVKRIPSGIDGSAVCIMNYSDFYVVISVSKTGCSLCGSEIIGDRGSVMIGNLHHMTDVSVTLNDGTMHKICGDIEKRELLKYEIADFYRCIEHPCENVGQYAYWREMSMRVTGILENMCDEAGLALASFNDLP